MAIREIVHPEDMEGYLNAHDLIVWLRSEVVKGEVSPLISMTMEVTAVGIEKTLEDLYERKGL